VHYPQAITKWQTSRELQSLPVGRFATKTFNHHQRLLSAEYARRLQLAHELVNILDPDARFPGWRFLDALRARIQTTTLHTYDDTRHNQWCTQNRRTSTVVRRLTSTPASVKHDLQTSSNAPSVSGLVTSSGFFLAFIMLGNVAYYTFFISPRRNSTRHCSRTRGSLRRKSVVTNAGSGIRTTSKPPST
jgi:hypothetical protein